MADSKHKISVSRLVFHIWGAQGGAGDAVWSCPWSLAPRAQAKVFWVSCVRNLRCLPCIAPHHTRQRARENLESSSASGQTHSCLHDLQFAWTIPSFWNYFSVRRKKLYFSLWSFSIFLPPEHFLEASWSLAGQEVLLALTTRRWGLGEHRKSFMMCLPKAAKKMTSVHTETQLSHRHCGGSGLLSSGKKRVKTRCGVQRDNFGEKKIFLWGP